MVHLDGELVILVENFLLVNMAFNNIVAVLINLTKVISQQVHIEMVLFFNIYLVFLSLVIVVLLLAVIDH